jgi:hypothetical protein
VAGGKREIASTAYGFLLKQLSYEKITTDLALVLLDGVRAYYEAT